MPKRHSIILNVPSVYGPEGTLVPRQVAIKHPEPNTARCCGETANEMCSPDGGPRCSKNATSFHVAVEVTTTEGDRWGRDLTRTVSRVAAVGFCKTHDPVHQARRARAKELEQSAGDLA